MLISLISYFITTVIIKKTINHGEKNLVKLSGRNYKNKVERVKD